MRLDPKQAQRRVDELIQKKGVAIAERFGLIEEEGRRQQCGATVQPAIDVLVDEGNETGVAAIAEHQIEVRKYLPAEEDEKAGDVERKRKDRVADARCFSLAGFA